MTPLNRYEVAGSGAAAFLQRLTTNNVDKSVGSVTYMLLLDETGGVRSDLTVARLASDRFQIGANGPMDYDWLSRHLPEDGSVTVRDITGRHAVSACGERMPAPWCSRCVRTISPTTVSSTSVLSAPTSVRLARKIAEQAPLKGWVARELAPGPEATTDDELLDYVHKTHDTVYHPAGTARMGSVPDPMVVLDPALRVKGISRLRVVDASAMPKLPAVNPNITVMTMAEKCADLIRNG